MSGLRISAALLFASGLALTGCGSDPEEDYLSALQEAAPVFADSENDVLLAAGDDVCTALGSGESIRDIYNSTISSGLDADAGLAIADAAVTHLCPDEDTDAVREMIDRLQS